MTRRAYVQTLRLLPWAVALVILVFNVPFALTDTVGWVVLSSR